MKWRFFTKEKLEELGWKPDSPEGKHRNPHGGHLIFKKGNDRILWNRRTELVEEYYEYEVM